MSKQIEGGQKQYFLRLPQVLEKIPVSKSTWWSGIRSGIFPKPIKLTERTSAWRGRDIDDLINRLGGEAPPPLLDNGHNEPRKAAYPRSSCRGAVP